MRHASFIMPGWAGMKALVILRGYLQTSSVKEHAFTGTGDQTCEKVSDKCGACFMFTQYSIMATHVRTYFCQTVELKIHVSITLYCYQRPTTRIANQKTASAACLSNSNPFLAPTIQTPTQPTTTQPKSAKSISFPPISSSPKTLSSTFASPPTP